MKLEQRIVVATALLTACANSNVTSALTMSDIDKTVVIYLKRMHLWTSGVGHETLNDKMSSKVPAAFPFLMTTIPADALLVDLLVTPEGGLNFLLAPGAAERDPKGVPGVLRRIAFVDTLNGYIDKVLGR